MQTTIRYGGREIEPLFDLAAWEEIEERFGDLSDAIEQIKDEVQPKARRRATIALAAILCNNALEVMGETEMITEQAMKHAIPSKRIDEVRYAVIVAINKGFRSDYDPADEEPVDVVLEEIAKKTSPGE